MGNEKCGNHFVENAAFNGKARMVLVLLFGMCLAVLMPCNKAYADVIHNTATLDRVTCPGQSLFLDSSGFRTSGYSVDSYTWSVMSGGDCISMGSRGPAGCYIKGVKEGYAKVQFDIQMSKTWIVYLDVKMQEKYYMTNYSLYTVTYNIYVGKEMTITFDPNGGQVSTTKVTRPYSSSCETTTYGTLPTPTRSGYAFMGWTYNGNYVSSSYTIRNGGVDRTLVAQWEEMYPYTVHFDGNGSTSGSMDDVTFYNQAKNSLPANKFKKSGNRLVGWALTPDCAPSAAPYKDKGIITKGLTDVKNGTVTLYAIWTDENRARGKCSDTVSWVIDAEDRLIIKGTGAMPDYSSQNDPPWAAYRDEITEIIIEEGITGIGARAFEDCENAEKIEIASTVETIGDIAFGYCNSIKSIHIPASVSKMDRESGLSWCKKLESITVDNENATYCDVDGVLFSKDMKTLYYCPTAGRTSYVVPNSVTRLDDWAFYKAKLEKLMIPESVTVLGWACFGYVQIDTVYFRGKPANMEHEIGLTSSYVNFSSAVMKTAYYPEQYAEEWKDGKTDYNNAYFKYDNNKEKPYIGWKMMSQTNDLKNAKITFNMEKVCRYDGTEQTLEIETVKDGDWELFEGVDYTVSYSDNVNIGTEAVMTLSGIGDYEGTEQAVTFTILKAEQFPEVTAETNQVELDGTLSITDVKGIGDISYESKTPSVAEVDGSGKIVAKALGETEIWIRASGDEVTEEGVAIFKVTVTKKSWDASGIVITPYAGTYDEAAHDAVAVTEAEGQGGVLSDKTVTYSTSADNTNWSDYSEAVPQVKEAGTVYVKVKVGGPKYKEWESDVQTVTVAENPGSGTPGQSGNNGDLPAGSGDGLPVGNDEIKLPEMNQVLSDSKINAKIKVTNTGKIVDGKVAGAEAEYVKPVKAASKINIPDKIVVDGVSYKVTSVAANAFKGDKKLTSVTIGKGVRKISKNAFYNCKKLSKITVKTTELTSVGKNAIKGIKKTAVITVPKSKYVKYKKLFGKKAGFGSKMKIKKK